MARLKSEKVKKCDENQKLLRWWKAWHREQREAVLTGPYAVTLVELFRMFANLECVHPAQLIGFISAIDWAAIDYEIRLIVLRELNNAITAYRIKRGLEPIADNLPSEPDVPFRTIKTILFPPRNEGAIRGAARRE